MRNVLDQVIAWHRHGTACVLATVVAYWGSAPRPVGTQGYEFCGTAQSGHTAPSSTSPPCSRRCAHGLATSVPWVAAEHTPARHRR
ncbi:XdhC family protein [Streptomyces sp. PU-14G]|uniref:XdhC family protein n=1 Tax=Streptomyces sp. PU-14G TaxID=2800808 RepID=UPI0034DF7CDC